MDLLGEEELEGRVLRTLNITHSKVELLTSKIGLENGIHPNVNDLPIYHSNLDDEFLFFLCQKAKHHKNPMRKHETCSPKNDLSIMLWCLMMSMVQLPLGKRMMTTVFSQHVSKRSVPCMYLLVRFRSSEVKQ